MGTRPERGQVPAGIEVRYKQAKSEAERQAVAEEARDLIRAAFHRARAWAALTPMTPK